MRTTESKKEYTIKLRVDCELRDYVVKESSRQGMTISEYVRKVIDRDRKK